MSHELHLIQIKLSLLEFEYIHFEHCFQLNKIKSAGMHNVIQNYLGIDIKLALNSETDLEICTGWISTTRSASIVDRTMPCNAEANDPQIS